MKHNATVTINGVDVAGDVLAGLLNAMTDPDPNVWYSFERIDTSEDEAIVTVKVRREVVQK